MKDEKIKTAHQFTNDLIGAIIRYHKNQCNIESLLSVIEVSFEAYHKQFESQPQKESALPSDKNIETLANNSCENLDEKYGFEKGAKWMRDKASSEIEALKAENLKCQPLLDRIKELEANNYEQNKTINKLITSNLEIQKVADELYKAVDTSYDSSDYMYNALAEYNKLKK